MLWIFPLALLLQCPIGFGWATCLTSLLVQENIPSCCFFPYLELHCYHHRSQGNYILFYQRPQSHIWQCKKQQFCKTGEITNNIASSISILSVYTYISLIHIFKYAYDYLYLFLGLSIFLSIYFIFGCAGSSLLQMGFLYLRHAGFSLQRLL